MVALSAGGHGDNLITYRTVGTMTEVLPMSPKYTASCAFLFPL